MRSLLLTLSLLFAGAASAADRPATFVEQNYDLYASGFSLDAVRQGRFEHPYYPPVDISFFDWKTSPVDRVSWWIRVEELRFLLPLIASGLEHDQSLARAYFAGWIKAHPKGANPNPGAWREPMTVARRGMVLVYWRERLLAATPPDHGYAAVLQTELERHALHLFQRFDRNSNHGLEEAMGMIELSRLFATPTFRGESIERMSSMVAAIVSPMGVELEHSPGYHFLVVDMLARYRDYLPSLAWVPRSLVAQVDTTVANMRRAGFHLYDHGGGVLQLGDTDSLQVSDEDRWEGDDPPALFADPIAGLVVYKGRGADRRYVAFSATSGRPRFRYHFHNDVGAVYYADDGETILGDGGAFEYTDSAWRSYFRGAASHNCIFHREDIGRKGLHIDAGFDPWATDTGGGAAFGIRMKAFDVDAVPARQSGEGGQGAGRQPGSCGYARGVRVGSGAGLVVTDTLATAKAVGHDRHVIAWHIGPGADIVAGSLETAAGEWSAVIATRRGRRFLIRMTLEGAAEWDAKVLRGEEQPIMGWHSPRSRVRRPRDSVLVSIVPGPEMQVTETRIEPVE